MGVGDKIKILHVYGEDRSYDGKEGIIESIDVHGQLRGTWGDLVVDPDIDEIIWYM